MRFDIQAACLSKEAAHTGLIDCHFDEEFIREFAADPTFLDAVEALNAPNALPSPTHIFEEWARQRRGEPLLVLYLALESDALRQTSARNKFLAQ